MLSVLKLYVSRNQSLISMVIFFICHIFGVPKMAHQFPFKIFLPSPESMATGRAGFMGVQPEQSHRTRTQKGPGLGLMLCCRYLEILINFWTRGPTNYVASLGYTGWLQAGTHLSRTWKPRTRATTPVALFLEGREEQDFLCPKD